MNNTYFIILVIVLIIVVIYLLRLFFSSGSKTNEKTNEKMLHLGNKKFTASSKYADVSYITSENTDTLTIQVNYKDLTGVSAIHIHVNDNGSPGPVLAWLGTTPEWQNGTVQNTPGTNIPCFNVNNRLCNLIAPENTPLISNLSNNTMVFTVKKNFCEGGCKCPWIKNGTLLDVHGFNFQKYNNGVPSKEKPGADIIDQQKFVMEN